MRLLTLDPGSTRTGWVLYDTTDRLVVESGDDDNARILDVVRVQPCDTLVVEMFASHGQASMGAASMCDRAAKMLDVPAHPTLQQAVAFVQQIGMAQEELRRAAQMARQGATATGDMCTAAMWLGAFIHAAGRDFGSVGKMTRKEVLRVFHVPSKGADSALRAELIRMHGGADCIKKGGALHGVKGDAWAALAVAVAWAHLNKDLTDAVALAEKVM